MITILTDDFHKQFVEKYAEKQNIGGFSNLAKKDLHKASRLDFQRTALYGELCWYMYRYKSADKLSKLLDYKFETLRPKRLGDNGFDDSITYNNKTRLIDIKSSHIEDENRIQYLNLVIPQREFHQNMIYICAFSVGKDRQNVDKVVFAGWEINENVHKKWPYDNSKFCVPTKELRDIQDLNVYMNDNIR